MTNIVPLIGSERAQVALNDIDEDPFLPRKSYSEEALAQLADSMQTQGLMQNIVVTRRSNGRFALIIGSRRIRAARSVGYTHIDAVVADIQAPVDILMLALSENVQRQDLEPLEEANAYLLSCQNYGLSIKDIATRIGRPSQYVRDRLKLLDLASEVQQFVADDTLSASTAAALAIIPSGEKQVEVAKEAVREGLSVHEVRTLVKEEGLRPVEGPKNVFQGSVQKYRLRMVKLREQMERDFAYIEKSAMTPDERGRLMKVHLELEEASKGIRDQISAGGRVMLRGAAIVADSSNIPSARNHGEVWPVQHMALLEDRTNSDEEIARQTGRTITAVQAMRKEMRRKK